MKLIDLMFEKGQKAVDKLKRPLVIGKLKRAFESAADSPQDVIIDKTLEIQKLRLRFVEEPEEAGTILNKILGCKESMRKATRSIELVEEERVALFETDHKEEEE